MLITLIRRELLDTLMTFRFAAVSLITLLLVVANTAVLIQDYEQRLASYHHAVSMHHENAQKAKSYQAAHIIIDRAPNPLSIFNVGLDKRLGNLVGIWHGFVPTLWHAQMHGTDNPFIAFFSTIDIVFIFQVILSLMGVIFAYDAIAGERERGTLRLVLAQPIQRGTLLLAKYISAMACLLVPLMVSLLFAVLLLTRSIPLSTADFLRIAGIVLTSFTYLSLFYLIGLLISAATRRSGTALMLSLFVWGFLILVYPNLIRATVNPGGNLQTRLKTAENRIQQILDDYKRERQKLLKREGIEGEESAFHKALGLYHDADVDPETLSPYIENGRSVIEEGIIRWDIRPEFEHYVPLAKRYYKIVEPLARQAADKAWLIQKPALEDIFVRQATLDWTWLKVSPVGVYDAATQAWAGTDLRGLSDFFEAAQRYRETVFEYFYATDAFSSREWFAPDTDGVAWRTFPKFAFERSGAWTHAQRALPDLLLLILCNLALFMGIVLVFIKSEV